MLLITKWLAVGEPFSDENHLYESNWVIASALGREPKK
jgi:hypothetical protein